MAAHFPGDGNLLPLSPGPVLCRVQSDASLQHCYCHGTELAAFMLSGSSGALLLTIWTLKHSTQAVQSAPIPISPQRLCVCVCSSNHSSKEQPGQRPQKTPRSHFITVNMCYCGIKVYAFFSSSNSSLLCPPKTEDNNGDLHPPPLTSFPVFQCSFCFVLNETTACG